MLKISGVINVDSSKKQTHEGNGVCYLHQPELLQEYLSRRIFWNRISLYQAFIVPYITASARSSARKRFVLRSLFVKGLIFSLL